MTLADYLRQQSLTPEEFGRLIGRSPGLVKKWRYGERLPRLPELLEIERLTNGAVTANDFVAAQPARGEAA